MGCLDSNPESYMQARYQFSHPSLFSRIILLWTSLIFIYKEGPTILCPKNWPCFIFWGENGEILQTEVSGGDGTGEPLAEDPEEEQGSTQATDVSIYSLLFEFLTDVKLFLFISIFHCCGSALVSMRIRVQLFISMRIRILIKLKKFNFYGSESWSNLKSLIFTWTKT